MTSNQTAFTITMDIDWSFDIDESTLIVNVTFLPCPLGLQSHNSTGECICNDIISSLQSQCDVSIAMEMLYKVVNKLSLWIWKKMVTVEHLSLLYFIVNLLGKRSIINFVTIISIIRILKKISLWIFTNFSFEFWRKCSWAISTDFRRK